MREWNIRYEVKLKGELLLPYLLSKRLGDEVPEEGNKARFITMGRIFIALCLHNIWTTRNDKVYKDLDPPEPHIRANLVWRKGKETIESLIHSYKSEITSWNQRDQMGRALCLELARKMEGLERAIMQWRTTLEDKHLWLKVQGAIPDH